LGTCFFNKFPVTTPVISLLIPCSDFRLEAIYSSVYEEINAIKLGQFPVFFPVNGNFPPETGSRQTASSASFGSADRTLTNKQSAPFSNGAKKTPPFPAAFSVIF
jgi:hypothetical protein